MAEVRWTRLAQSDLEQIAYHVGVVNHRQSTARRLIDEIVAKCQHYAAHPRMGSRQPALGEQLRVLSHKGYVVIYEPLDDGLEVLRVVHGARDYPMLFP